MVRSQEARIDDWIYKRDRPNSGQGDLNLGRVYLVPRYPDTALGWLCEWLQPRQSELSKEGHAEKHCRLLG